VSLGHPFQFQRLSRIGSVTARHSSTGRQPNFAALNRGCHLYLAGRPSRWALAHILVIVSHLTKPLPTVIGSVHSAYRSQFPALNSPSFRYFVMAALRSRCGHYIFTLFLSLYLFSSPNLSGRRLDVYHTSTHGVVLARI